MTRDPVCGMAVDEQKAGGATSTYRGTSYYFCSEACKQKFEQVPERYAAGGPSGHHH